jgi:indolepyruvate ferredoxin oxidoreductase alpha subunit
MHAKTLNGDQAMAYGALSGGVKLVTSYPGSPSSGTVEVLIHLAKEHEIYVEWSSNEKVAMEMGIGASIAGRRALVCAKSVGMNVMIDPLMVLNLTPVHGGLVILLGDDPGGYGSQNDQDTRPIASMLEMPMMEPSSPAEGYSMIREAFEISERFNTAVIIRETRSFTQQLEAVSVTAKPCQVSKLGLIREPWRFVPVPRNVVEKHRNLHQKVAVLSHWADGSAYNRVIGSGKKGIVGAGFAFRKLLDVIGDQPIEGLCLLKLSILYPLPENLIAGFLTDCNEIMVLEENEPYLETRIKAIAHDLGCRTKIFGKQSNHISREGELFRWQIQKALSDFMPEFGPAVRYLQENEAQELPKRENNCTGCNYGKILDILQETAKRLQQKPVIVGDPGCLVTVAERLDAKYALGSAVGVADGISKVATGEHAVAIFGDSSFFHTSLPAICNAAHNRSNILMVVLDNGAAVATGYQPHPGTGKDAMGRETPALSIENIARACGVKKVHAVGPDDLDGTLGQLFKKALIGRDLTLIVVRTEFGKPGEAG